MFEHAANFRSCYLAGLARNPRLQGRVTVRFVINREGLVEDAVVVTDAAADALVAEPGTQEFFAKLGLPAPVQNADLATSLPDAAVIACVVERYRAVTFPPPEGGGIVKVVYPILFEPDDAPQR